MARTGFVTELELQKLIKDSPELLGPVNSDLVFVPIGWEVPLGAGRLDALFLDSNGLLTLVETKLRANDESRREVIGQVLEYAAAAADWDFEQLRRTAQAFLSSPHAPGDIMGRTFEEAIAIRLGWLDLTEDERATRLQSLCAQSDSNLRAGHLRVVCGVDERIHNLERLVAYLTLHSDLEVILLQVNRFPVEDGLSVLIPSLHGNVEERPGRRQSNSARMTLAEIIESYPDGAERRAVAHLIDVARNAGASFEPGPVGTSIRAKSPAWKPVSIAWVFMPGRTGWQKTREVSLGHGLATSSKPAALDQLLDEYLQKVTVLGGSDASSKDVRARWFTGAETSADIARMCEVVEQMVFDLAKLPPVEAAAGG